MHAHVRVRSLLVTLIVHFGPQKHTVLICVLINLCRPGGLRMVISMIMCDCVLQRDAATAVDVESRPLTEKGRL